MPPLQVIDETNNLYEPYTDQQRDTGFPITLTLTSLPTETTMRGSTLQNASFVLQNINGH